VALKKTKPVLEIGCVHHWIIESADGPWSSGFCLKCRINKEFSNSMDKEVFWMTPKAIKAQAFREDNY